VNPFDPFSGEHCVTYVYLHNLRQEDIGKRYDSEWDLLIRGNVRLSEHPHETICNCGHKQV